MSVHDLKDIDRILSDPRSGCIMISGTRFSSPDLRYISDAISAHQGLRYVSITECGINDEGFAILSSGVNARIETFDISRNPITDAAAPTIESLVRTSQKLLDLNLSSTSLTDAVTPTISRLLAGNPQLKRLSLNDTQIGDKGVVKITQGLHSNTNLRTLEIRTNLVIAEGIVVLADARTRNPRFDVIGVDLTLSEFLRTSRRVKHAMAETIAPGPHR